MMFLHGDMENDKRNPKKKEKINFSGSHYFTVSHPEGNGLVGLNTNHMGFLWQKAIWSDPDEENEWED